MQYTPQPIAIGYRRVSTDKQQRSGLGLEDQAKAIADFCEHRGLTLAATFVEAESGKNNDRPELAKAIALAKRKRAVLVVSTLSRLGRRVLFVANLMETGVPFTCADAPDDEPFILHVKASFAEEEARKISQRTKAALAVLKANGKRLGLAGRWNLTDEGRRRAGSTVRGRAQAEHAVLLPQILAARSQGLSIRAIAERVGTSPMTVSRLLRRAA